MRELVLLLVLAAAGCSSAPREEVTPEPVAREPFSAELQEPSPGEFRLKVCVTPATEITINASSLPWEHRYAMLLVAAPLRDAGASVVPSPLYVADLGLLSETLEAERERCGEIDLAHRFPGLADALKEDDVALFWLYNLRNLGESAGWAGGHAVIPRNASRGEEASDDTKSVTDEVEGAS
jgi:hypothetical protein